MSVLFNDLKGMPEGLWAKMAEVTPCLVSPRAHIHADSAATALEVVRAGQMCRTPWQWRCCQGACLDPGRRLDGWVIRVNGRIRFEAVDHGKS